MSALIGIGLALSGDYGTFAQLWIYGTLAIYVLIQITMIAGVGPVLKNSAIGCPIPLIST